MRNPHDPIPPEKRPNLKDPFPIADEVIRTSFADAASFRRLRKKILGFVRIVYSEADWGEQEDCADEIMLRVLNALRAGPERATCLNAVIRWQTMGVLSPRIRRKNRWKEFMGQLTKDVTDKAPHQEAAYIRLEKAELIREQLSKLTERERQVLWAVEVEDLSREEVQHAFGLSETQVKSALFTGRRKSKLLLADLKED